MNPNFEIKEKTIIYNILDKAEYGTLALCVENKPSVKIQKIYNF